MLRKIGIIRVVSKVLFLPVLHFSYEDKVSRREQNTKYKQIVNCHASNVTGDILNHYIRLCSVNDYTDRLYSGVVLDIYCTRAGMRATFLIQH